jgi:pimeloyl-ACP methyl ester carboxylesterase
MKFPWAMAAVASMRLAANAAQCNPAMAGPHSVGQQSVGIPGTSGATLSTDVYFPAVGAVLDATAAPCPVIVLGHGFSGSKSQHANTGRHLATRGYIVLIPDFNGGSDHARNAQDMRRCLDWMEARHADPASVFFGQVRLDRFGASGYSAGGLSAILAAAQDARIGVLSLLDPVDNGGQGVTALPGLAIPVAMTWSEPSSCNANASATTLYGAARGVKRGMRIVGANHTDPQDPASPFAALLCGAANATRQVLYRRYLTSWFDFYLREDRNCIGSVFNYPGGVLTTDLAANRVTYSAPLAPLTLEANSLNNGFALTITGPPGQRFVIEEYVEAGPWYPAATNQLGNAALRLTNTVAVENARFRTRSVP